MSAEGSSAKSGRKAPVALGAVILVALNLRAAVTSVPPIYDRVAQSFPVSTQAQSVMGSLPLLCFALFGMAAPSVSRRFGLVNGLLLAMAMVATGEFGRAALSRSIVAFGLLSILCLGGIGIANVLLLSLVKRFFPGRMSLVSSLFQGLMVLSASVPSLVAVPLTQRMDWRFAVGFWGVAGVAAMIPLAYLARERDAPIEGLSGNAIAVWRWPTAWAVMIVFSMGPTVMYAMIAWLPKVLTQTAGVSPATAGTMLAVYSAVGLAHSMIVPLVLPRLRRPFLIVAFAVACLMSGTLGLGYLPRLSWLWIILAGLGPMLLNIGLTLVNMRSRTEAGTTALSGFVQSLGYLIAATGPFLAGYLHAATGSWLAPCWFMVGAGAVALLAAYVALRPVFIEDMSTAVLRL